MNQSELMKQFARGGADADAANARLERLIEKTNGNMRKVAEELGVCRTTLYRIFARKRGYLRLVKQARQAGR